MIFLLIVGSRIVRSFYNGLFGAFLLYFFYYSLNFQAPLRLSLMFSASVAINTIKSKLLETTIRQRKINASLAYSFAFYLLPLAVIMAAHSYGIIEGIVYVLFIVFGLHPADGEDILILQTLQEKYLSRVFGSSKSDALLGKLTYIGFIFQAVGSLFSLTYLTYNIENFSYVFEPKVRFLMNFSFLLALINAMFFTFYQFQQLRREKPQDNQNEPPANANKIKAFVISDGFYHGLLPAPFIAYYLDLKLNFDEWSIGLMLFAFFLAKGLGTQIISNTSLPKNCLIAWSFASNLSLLITGFAPKLAFFSFLLAFPVWNYCTIPQKQYTENSKYWNKLGVALGILTSSLFFAIFPEKVYFSYPVILFGALGMIKILKMPSSFQRTLVKDQKQYQLQIVDITSRSQIEGQVHVEESQQQKGAHSNISRSKILLASIFFVFPFIIAGNFYSQSCYWLNSCQILKTKSDQIDISPKLGLYNQSLAHFLLKENARDVKLMNCDQACQVAFQGRKGKYYEQLRYDSSAPSWLHFPQMPYSSAEQVVAQIQEALLQNSAVRGYSLFWSNPLLYNKMPEQVEPSLVRISEKYNFYYSEMPSLNLRGAENAVIMIFTKTPRTQGQLPHFVSRRPPANMLAIEATFKLVTHYRFLREYILYHLRMGVDKFFLYDNNRDKNSTHYFQEYHGLDKFLRNCSDNSTDELYGLFEDIWEEFYDHIVYIPWRVRGSHPQGEAHLHYSLYFRNIAKFTSFTDLDQYLASRTGKYIPDILNSYLENQFALVLISSRSFRSRSCMHGQLALEQYSFVSDRSPTYKSIGLTKGIVDHAIHDKTVKNGRYASLSDDSEIYMLHYTVSAIDNPLPTEGKDYSLRPLIQGMKQSCQQKCNDGIRLTCTDQQFQELALNFCKQL